MQSGTVYNLFWAFTVRGKLDTKLLAGCMADVIHRHEVRSAKRQRLPRAVPP